MKNILKKYLQGIKTKSVKLLFQTAPFVPLAPINAQSTGKLSGLYTGTDLASFAQTLFAFAITIGAIIAVVRLMIAGYYYMFADTASWASKTKAREIFTDVIIGLLLLLAIWIVLLKINPQLLNLDVLRVIKDNRATGLTAPAGSQNQPSTTPCPPPSTYRDPNTGECL